MSLTTSAEKQITQQTYFTDKFPEKLAKDLMKMLVRNTYLKEYIPILFPLDLVQEIVKCFIATYEGKQCESRLLVKGTIKAVVVGDLHGDMATLKRILEERLYEKNIYVFLGDYVDKGNRGVEVMLALMIMHIINPRTVVMLRGNHEDANINISLGECGFMADCESYYGDIGKEVFNAITSVYAYLPISCTINGTLYFAHGGIPRDLDALERRSVQLLPIDSVYKHEEVYQTLWNDPDVGTDTSDYMHVDYVSGNRGPGSMRFGKVAVDRFLAKTGCRCIIRGHQFSRDEPVFTTPDSKVITVFSSVNYIGVENDAAVLVITLSKTSTTFAVDYIPYSKDAADNQDCDSDDDDNCNDMFDDSDDDTIDCDIVEDPERYYDLVMERFNRRRERRRLEKKERRERAIQRELNRSAMVININNNFVTIDERHIVDDSDINRDDYFPVPELKRIRNTIEKYSTTSDVSEPIDIDKDDSEDAAEIHKEEPQANGKKKKLFDFS